MQVGSGHFYVLQAEPRFGQSAELFTVGVIGYADGTFLTLYLSTHRSKFPILVQDVVPAFVKDFQFGLCLCLVDTCHQPFCYHIIDTDTLFGEIVFVEIVGNVADSLFRALQIGFVPLQLFIVF